MGSLIPSYGYSTPMILPMYSTCFSYIQIRFFAFLLPVQYRRRKEEKEESDQLLGDETIHCISIGIKGIILLRYTLPFTIINTILKVYSTCIRALLTA